MNDENDYSNWLEILNQEVEKSSIAKVAEKLEYSKTTVSLVLAGKYQGKTDKVAEKVIQIFTVIHCPYLEDSIPTKQCRDFALGRAPTHSPPKMQHWRACRRCPLKPEEPDS